MHIYYGGRETEKKVFQTKYLNSSYELYSCIALNYIVLQYYLLLAAIIWQNMKYAVNQIRPKFNINLSVRIGSTSGGYLMASVCYRAPKNIVE